MTALLDGLDLRPALLRANDHGVAFLALSLDEGFGRGLAREIDAGPFERFPESFGAVRQEIDGYDVRTPMKGYPMLSQLGEELVWMVRAQGRGVPGLATWMPTEAGIARYRPGSLGITPHLDGKSYRRLVAVFTLYGSARFSHCRDRAGEVIESWQTGSGSLVVMRGPGLGRRRDGRPFHTVEGPERGVRCSIAFRMQD